MGVGNDVDNDERDDDDDVTDDDVVREVDNIDDGIMEEEE